MVFEGRIPREMRVDGFSSRAEAMGSMLKIASMMKRGRAVILALGLVAQAGAEPVMVGACKVQVTPREPVVLAGYGARIREWEGIDAQLWTRALVIGEKDPVAIVVLDNCGVPGAIKARLVKRLAEHGIGAERLVVAATHTHNAPNLIGYAPVLWAGRTTVEQDERMGRYTDFAVTQMALAVTTALKKREPMHLEWAQGRATFGGNRRVLREGKWAGFGFQRDKPVDHSLPVLAARDESGEVRVLWANYACHCTTVGSRNHVGGDWAGYANRSMERAFPAATALMTIGCGADIGPQPSGNLQIAEEHGETIGAEVRRLLAGEMKKLKSGPAVTGKSVKLPLVESKPRKHWEELRVKGGFEGQLALAMLKKLDAGGNVPSQVDYPVTSWTFGSDLAMVFLPGEVVVDYAVRLNRELAWPRLWITAWSNDMPGYIPSKRVLEEGGYEAEFSQVYYQLPGRYRAEIEEVVIGAVREVVGEAYMAPADQEGAPFHRLPSGEEVAFRRLANWAAGAKSTTERQFLRELSGHARVAGPAISRVMKHEGEEARWFNFAGDQVERMFIRQERTGAELGWKSPVLHALPSQPLVLCFTGGVGWRSQPQRKGFALTVNGQESLVFGVSSKPARWVSKDGEIELWYLPTWTSNEDSGGFFFIVIGESFVAPKEKINFSVRSLGEGSKRWFAIDSKQEIGEKLVKFNAALKSSSQMP